MLDYVVGMFGADKVALGTDYPFPLGELEPGKLIKEMPYERDVKELLLNGAALQWLNLKKEKFL